MNNLLNGINNVLVSTSNNWESTGSSYNKTEGSCFFINSKTVTNPINIQFQLLFFGGTVCFSTIQHAMQS